MEAIAESFDLVVIGTGSAGATVARTCRSAGWSVAIVDSRPFGGTCALRGCDPKLVLIGAAELVDWATRFRSKGVVTGELQIDWPSLMRFKKTFTDGVPANRERFFAEAGIATFHGRARFLDGNAVSVGDAALTGRFIVIAAGAKRRPLRIPGEELLTSSTEFLELPSLPHEIIFIGGGYISFELAHLAARAGARVRILHGGPHPLKGFDRDLVDQLVQISRDIGVDVVLGPRVGTIERTAAGKIVVRAKGQSGEDLSWETDMAVHGAGRVPEIDDLELEVGGVARSPKGVRVNQYLQSTTNAAVYAAGDAVDAGGLPLTPVAGTEGEVVADNLLHGNRRTMDFSGLVTCVFTIPPLASVGLTESEAKDRGLKYQVRTEDSTNWFSSRRLATRHSSSKVLIEEGSGQMLGASILGPHAEEIANVFALAIRKKIPAAALRDVLYGYPTGSSDIEYIV